MPMPTAPLGEFRPGSALKRAAAMLAAAILLSPGTPPQAALAGPASQEHSAPQPTQELRAKVISLVNQPDAFPPYGARWQPLGSAAFHVLEELASNPKAPRLQRARAVTSMATVDHPQATERLRSLLEDKGIEPPLRASAATALGLRVGSEAISTLLPFLQDRDEQVRIAVARVLGRLGGSQVQQALEERIPLEQNPLVREALQQSLTFVEP